MAKTIVLATAFSSCALQVAADGDVLEDNPMLIVMLIVVLFVGLAAVVGVFSLVRWNRKDRQRRKEEVEGKQSQRLSQRPCNAPGFTSLLLNGIYSEDGHEHECTYTLNFERNGQFSGTANDHSRTASVFGTLVWPEASDTEGKISLVEVQTRTRFMVELCGVGLGAHNYEVRTEMEGELALRTDGMCVLTATYTTSKGVHGNISVEAPAAPSGMPAPEVVSFEMNPDEPQRAIIEEC
mmetsp:Transcript_69473/g.166522  ORF Transcript_69473/g.166522 Transcript_69473/m.166522 type:complete len:238 (-) Transcript_69473:140-853(-)